MKYITIIWNFPFFLKPIHTSLPWQVLPWQVNLLYCICTTQIDMFCFFDKDQNQEIKNKTKKLTFSAGKPCSCMCMAVEENLTSNWKFQWQSNWQHREMKICWAVQSELVKLNLRGKLVHRTQEQIPIRNLPRKTFLLVDQFVMTTWSPFQKIVSWWNNLIFLEHHVFQNNQWRGTSMK